MTKRYKTLQKKLQELEAEVSLIFSLPAETPYHHLLSECIQQRFVFLKNLLSAEIASHPSKPSHLRHIGKRLNELEIAFCEWDDYRRSVNYNLDSASICSCNESSLNDDGEAASDLPNLELGSFEDEVSSPRALVKVKVQEGKEKGGSDHYLGSCEAVEGQQQKNSPRAKVNGKGQEGKGEVGNEEYCNEKAQEVKKKVGKELFAGQKKERSISFIGKYFGALIGGMILGIILMGAAIAMVGDYSGYSGSTVDEGFLFST